MRLFLKPPWIFILVFILLFLVLKHSFYLRSIGYDQIPETYVVLDERTWVWQGLSIRKTGIPAGWSQLQAYKKGFGGAVEGLNVSVDEKRPTIQNFANFPKPALAVLEFDYGKGTRHTPIVQPLIEQPPLGGLILSGLVSSNVKTFTDLTPFEFRKTSLWLGVLTGILIFILGWQVSNNPFVGLIGTGIYGSAPTFILLSRYALLENVLSPLMLLMINLLIFGKNLKDSNRRYGLMNWKFILILSGIASGLAALSKITGWLVLPLGIILLLYFRIKTKELLFFAIPAVFVGLLYFIWALYLAPGLFLDIFLYQSVERGFIGSLNFLTAATRVGILNFPFDGWWIGGFLSLILIPFRKEYTPIFIGAAVVILITLLTGGANFPWYFIPMIPFMCLSTALFIWQVATNPRFVSIIIFFLVFVSSTFYWGYGVFQASLLSTNYQQPYGIYRILLIFFVAAGLILSIQSRFKKLNYLWFIFMVVFILILIRFNERSIYFILSNWGKLPSLYTPGTF